MNSELALCPDSTDVHCTSSMPNHLARLSLLYCHCPHSSLVTTSHHRQLVVPRRNNPTKDWNCKRENEIETTISLSMRLLFFPLFAAETAWQFHPISWPVKEKWRLSKRYSCCVLHTSCYSTLHIPVIRILGPRGLLAAILVFSTLLSKGPYSQGWGYY